MRQGCGSSGTTVTADPSDRPDQSLDDPSDRPAKRLRDPSIADEGISVSTSSIFAYPDAWSGGYYELAMELGSRSDERLRSALATLWAYGGLDGCYLDSTLEPWQQRRVQPV